MVSATAQPSTAKQDHRVILSGITWDMYVDLADQLERAGRRLMLTYDDGELEVEMPSEIHELIKAFVRAMLELYLIDTQRPWELCT